MDGKVKITFAPRTIIVSQEEFNSENFKIEGGKVYRDGVLIGFCPFSAEVIDDETNV